MSDELPPLDDDVQGMLAGLRREVAAPSAARARVASRLSASLGLPMGLVGGALSDGDPGADVDVPDMAMAPPVDGASGVDAAVEAASAVADPDVLAAAAPAVLAVAKSASIAAPAAASAATVGATATVATGTTASVGVLAMLTKPVVVGAFVAGSMLGGGTVKVIDEAIEKPRVVYLPAPSKVVADNDVVEVAEPVVEPAPVADERPRDVVRKDTKDREKPRVKRPTTTDDAARAPDEAARALAKERALLEVARTALSRGDATAALASLEKHRAQFSDAKLGEERDALLVLALVGAGRVGEAEKAAARFERAHPRSLLLSTVKAAVAR